MRKTKKQKIRAEFRRNDQNLTASQIASQIQPNQVAIDLKEITAKVIGSSMPAKLVDNVDNSDDYSYIVSDLRKLAVLAFLAIATQLILYLTLV